MPKKPSPRCLLVLVTAPSLRVARSIAGRLLDERLIACANLTSGVESHYVWKGKREKTREVLMLMKTTRARVASLEKRVVELHPYDTPEFVTVNLNSGNKRYLSWVLDSVSAWL